MFGRATGVAGIFAVVQLNLAAVLARGGGGAGAHVLAFLLTGSIIGTAFPAAFFHAGGPGCGHRTNPTTTVAAAGKSAQKN